MISLLFFNSKKHKREENLSKSEILKTKTLKKEKELDLNSNKNEINYENYHLDLALCNYNCHLIIKCCCVKY